mmetsp:Transcript_6747/g.21771  ORF Transcript_6747/g.21771 Transcript_6747/m.21771 type:complete len:242 (-) Transcript_6747:1071-1796(-)
MQVCHSQAARACALAPWRDPAKAAGWHAGLAGLVALRMPVRNAVLRRILLAGEADIEDARVQDVRKGHGVGLGAQPLRLRPDPSLTVLQTELAHCLGLNGHRRRKEGRVRWHPRAHALPDQLLRVVQRVAVEVAAVAVLAARLLGHGDGRIEVPGPAVHRHEDVLGQVRRDGFQGVASLCPVNQVPLVGSVEAHVDEAADEELRAVALQDRAAVPSDLAAVVHGLHDQRVPPQELSPDCQG